MTHTPHVAVEPRPDGRWAVRTDGSRRASRLFDRKVDAVLRARAQVSRSGGELVIRDHHGRIERTTNHLAGSGPVGWHRTDRAVPPLAPPPMPLSCPGPAAPLDIWP